MNASKTLLLAFLLGCGGAPAVNTATYPPSFAYVDRQDLRSEMWSLARDVNKLDGILRADAVSAGDVADVLRNMEGTIRKLRDRGTQTNHPRLDANLDLFMRDVTGAREAVEAQPANYFLAGAISGSCLYCHR